MKGTTGTGVNTIREMVTHSDEIISQLRRLSFSPTEDKVLQRRYSITQVSELVGRSAQAIRQAEKSGALPMPETDERGRRVGYRLAEVNRIRDHFGIRSGRAVEEPTVRLAIQNFKGGAGKSTSCTQRTSGHCVPATTPTSDSAWSNCE